MTSRSDSPSGVRIAGLGISATLAAAACVFALFHHAQDPELAILDAERQAAQALNRIGYTWARVSVEDGVAHISGIAPGEPERVLAYEVVYKTLRPEMTKTMSIRQVASHLTLPVDLAAGSELPPPVANFKIPAAAPDWAAAPELVAEAVEAAADRAAPSVLGTTWHSAAAAPLPRIPTEATVFEVAQLVTTNSGTTWYAANSAPLPRIPEHAQVFKRIEFAAIDAEPQPGDNFAAIGSEDIASTTGRIETTANEPTPAAAPELTTAAIEKAAPQTAADCTAEFAAAERRANLSFASTSASIRPESKSTLDKLAGIARRCSQLSIAIEGHTDGYGERSYNLSLSRKRAEAVRRALIARGVPWRRITAKGYGAARPLSRNPARASRNRRIEFALSDPEAVRAPRGAQLK